VTVTVFRIVKRKESATAFDGEGARAYPGRWNGRGVPMVYASETRALAALEMLVHLEAEDLLASYYVLIPADVPDDLILSVADPLPPDWNAHPASASTRAIGDDWVTAGGSAVLAVPSAVIPAERNYLINPLHPDFPRITVGPAEPFDFDPRLAG
jgi:RES domain-containing protein